MAEPSYGAQTGTYSPEANASEPSSDVSSGFSGPDLIPSWERSLRAARLADRTIGDYLKDTRRFYAWCAAQGMPADPARQTREHVEAFIVQELGRVSERTGRKIAPGSVASAYRRLQQWFRWLHEEGEITSNPMANMRPPKVEETPVPVVKPDHKRRLLATCTGTDFVDRRDTAILRLFFDAGVRLGGMAGIELEQIDWDEQRVPITAKGGRTLVIPFGAKTAVALDRYVRARTRHRYAKTRWLWLGQKGKLTDSGIYQLVDRRCVQADVPHIHPHQARHTVADEWLKAGGNETDLMELMGWESRDMLQRYGKSAAVDRAHQAHRRLALGDQF